MSSTLRVFLAFIAITGFWQGSFADTIVAPTIALECQKQLKKDALANAHQQFAAVANYIPELKDKKLYDQLLNPSRVIEVEFAVQMDNGQGRSFHGWRSLHSNRRGRGQGGTRFSQEVERNEVIALSTWMTWKTAIAGIEFGGGKGGVKVNPAELSEGELERVARGYVRALLRKDGSALNYEIDGTAPDVGSNGKIMRWMLDEYLYVKVHAGELKDKALEKILKLELEKYKNKPIGVAPLLAKGYELRNEHYFPELGLITGKDVAEGGSLGRTEATGMGVYYTAREVAKTFFNKNVQAEKPLSGLKFAVQGFGNVGSYSALFIAETGGGQVTRLVEYAGGKDPSKSFVILNNPKGIPVRKLYDHIFVNKKSIADFSDGETEIKRVSSDEALNGFVASPVDILVPAAKENQLTEENVKHVKAKYVIEGANGPTTAMADKILQQRGVVVVPDVLANMGGVIVSYFEWRQNESNEYLSKEKVFELLADKFKNSFQAILEIYRTQQGISFRQAAYIYGVSSEVKALRTAN